MLELAVECCRDQQWDDMTDGRKVAAATGPVKRSTKWRGCRRLGVSFRCQGAVPHRNTAGVSRARWRWLDSGTGNPAAGEDAEHGLHGNDAGRRRSCSLAGLSRAEAQGKSQEPKCLRKMYTCPCPSTRTPLVVTLESRQPHVPACCLEERVLNSIAARTVPCAHICPWNLTEAGSTTAGDGQRVR